MADPFLGQITLLACNFPPYNWMMCQGQLLPIRQYSALFSLLGTAYGGDGQNTFGLPDLRGRVPIGQGQGPGLENYTMGETGGIEGVTLTTATIPPHNHGLQAYTGTGTTVTPTGALTAEGVAKGGHSGSTKMYLYNSAAPNVALAMRQVNPATGGNLSHNNLQPLLALNWCISLGGIFPSRP